MNPGDSLIDKIFEEGINKADAIIIVLSKNSVDKPWVREELNASMIKKIKERKKLIPVLIDDCKVPECLQSVVWEQIKDINKYDSEFERIVASIYGHYEKPELGEHPKYVQTIISLVPGLSKVDSLVLKLACEKAIVSNEFHIETCKILGEANLLDINSEVVLESLEILEGRGYFELHRVLGGGGLGNIPHFRITTFGFEEYVKVYMDNYDSIMRSIGLQIVNNSQTNSLKLQETTNYPLLLIEHVLEVFILNGFIRVSKYFAGRTLIQIMSVSPELKRALRD